MSRQVEATVLPLDPRSCGYADTGEIRNRGVGMDHWAVPGQIGPDEPEAYPQSL